MALHADMVPYRLVARFKQIQAAHRQGLLHASFDTLDVREMGWAVYLGYGYEGNAGDTREYEYLLNERQTKIGDYMNACWAVWWLDFNVYGDWLQGSGFYTPWYHVYGRREEAARQIGGQCEDLSRYGWAVARAHGVMAGLAGQPGHCAYVVRTGEGWPIAYDVGGPAATDFRLPGWEGTGYATTHWLYEPVQQDRARFLAANRLAMLARLLGGDFKRPGLWNDAYAQAIQAQDWGQNRFSRGEAKTATQFARVLGDYFRGQGGDANQERMRVRFATGLRTASERGDLEAARVWLSLAKELLPPLQPTEVQLSPEQARDFPKIMPFAGQLLSGDGLLRASTASSKDRRLSSTPLIVPSRARAVHDWRSGRVGQGQEARQRNDVYRPASRRLVGMRAQPEKGRKIHACAADGEDQRSPPMNPIAKLSARQRGASLKPWPALSWIWAALGCLGLVGWRAPAADWPMWRGDAARTASASEPLPETLHLQWVREYPPLKPAFWLPRQERLQFDLGYEPVVLGQTLFVASSRNDRLTALDAVTGAEKWRFYADGPIRLAPAAWEGKVYFGSDDGCFYCLAAESGLLQWKVRIAPGPRKVLGNGRLISVWPVRGGPVVEDGRVYLAAGVWPFEGVFVQALEARSGRSLWINDRLGARYVAHPHGAMSFGGPSPQGYLLLHRGRLVVPSSRAFPAFLEPATGELLSFDFGHAGHGSRPGSWFVATDETGGLAVDPELNTEIHDVGQQTIGQRGVKRQPGEVLPESLVVGQEPYRLREGLLGTVRVGPRVWRFEDGFPGVEGTIHTMLAAGGRLYVVTRAGTIYCFGGARVDPNRYPLRTQPLAKSGGETDSVTRSVLPASGPSEGYALVWGLGTGRVAEELAAQPQWHVVVVDREAEKIAAFRRRLDAAGWYGEKIAAHASEALAFGWPPYLANLIVCEDLAAAGLTLDEKLLDVAFETLRPYGGTLCLRLSPAQHETLAVLVKRPTLAGAQLRRESGYSLVVRAGPLPGAADYTGQPNFDERVKGPLGLLWFGDTFQHHKLFYQGIKPESGRGLPPFLKVVDGVMTYLVTEPIGASPPKLSYAAFLQKLNTRTYAEAFADIYTGRILAQGPATTPAEVARRAPERSISLSRRNPITGAEEAREYVKNHGCDLAGADYGHLITMRSGTPAYYDKRVESGTVNLGGTRSGCRNTIIPAGGVLSLPTWTGNCSCNYPVFTSLALVPMPESFEQWSAWGGLAEDGLIQRVGINFGAPGDRMTADGTLWLGWPSSGGPSPDVRLEVGPTNAQPFYRHAARMQGGSGWPWVYASGLTGVRTVRLETIARATNSPGTGFSARWTGFVRTELSETNAFHASSDGTVRLWVDGFPVLNSERDKSNAAPRETTGRLFLEGRRPHTLHAEYVHPTGARGKTAWVTLSWSSPSRTKAIIPAEALSAPDGRRGGLAGVYFANTRAAGPGLVQVDEQINFQWGEQRPALLRKGPPPRAAQERPYTVRLVFAEPESLQEGERVFGVRLQGRSVLANFDIGKEAGGLDRGTVREFRGIHVAEALTLEFLPASPKPPLICGVELIAENR